MPQHTIHKRTYSFALQIVLLVQDIQAEKKEYVLSRQLLRSGTSIGAMIRESKFAESKPDLIHKLKIALKEANETEYWLSLLLDSGYSTITDITPLSTEINELISILVTIVRKLKEPQSDKTGKG